MLKLSNVSARYDLLTEHVYAVNKVDFSINDDEIFGIAGESGCGKSTLLKVMYDLIEYPLEITDGVVQLYDNRDGEENSKCYETGEIRNQRWKSISYVPQGAMHVLNPVKIIESQFFDVLVEQKKRKGKKALREEIISYLRELELPPEVMKAYPHQLSGGMRQRILIALAMICNPSLVLADEPTTALDVVVQRGILAMLSRVQRKIKNSIVIVSHDMGVHYQITKRMGMMYAGEMIEIGPTDDIFDRPAHPYTKMLIAALPKIGDLSQKEGIPGTPPGLKNPPKGCRFAARCTSALDHCREVPPERTQVGDNHFASCHLLGGGVQ